MANNYFEFKQFRIDQGDCAMKVGTDGVLLGAWVNLESANRILDLGAGTGLISIMLAQRSAEANILGIEIDKLAFVQAQDNVNVCPWSGRIQIMNQAIQEFHSEMKFDLLISNPPFFIKSQKAPDHSRNLARHTDSLNFDDILKSAKSLLSETGRLALIYPTTEAELFMEKANSYGFFLNRLCKVYPTPRKAVRRYLMEFSKEDKGLQESSIIIEMGKRHDYSMEYMALCKDFYLKF